MVFRYILSFFTCLALVAASDPALAAKKKKPRPAVVKSEPKPKPAVKARKKAVPIPEPKPQLSEPKGPEAEQVVPKTETDTPKDDKPRADEKNEIAGAESAEAKAKEGESCRLDLQAKAIAFSIPDEVKTEGACRVDAPVMLSSIASVSGKIDLPGKPLLNCNFARQFATWAADVAAPAVEAHMGSPLAALSTGPGYQCRGRNGDLSGKISEHGLGNAIDIDVIVLADKRRIAISAVGDITSPARRMLAALRTSGCGYFTTVLGPGSNEAHKEHFHFDMAVRGKKGNYRICE